MEDFTELLKLKNSFDNNSKDESSNSNNELEEKIKEALTENSPIELTNKYQFDLETIGPLVTYKQDFDEDGHLKYFINQNGFKEPVYMTDKDGNFIIEDMVKWDEHGEFDIKRGIEIYDDFYNAKEQNETVNEETIITDKTLQQLYTMILDEAIENEAEDIIIYSEKNFGLVRHFNGQYWQNSRVIYKSCMDPLLTIFKKNAGLKYKLENYREEQTNGQIVYRNHNFRIAADSNQYGIFLVLRQQAKAFYSLDELEIPNDVKKVFRRAVGGKDGLIIVGGPPGSGKTTLMTTALAEYQTQTNGSANIISLEQPIETPLPGIIQKDIDEDLNLTWDGAISASLREKPQIIRVGETSTKETAKAIVRASNSGVVAMTTLHIKSAIEVFETLKSLGIPDNDIKNSLRVVIYLNRVPRLCPHCKIEKSIFAKNDINMWVKRNLNDNKSGALSSICFRNPNGCEVCRKKQKNPKLYGTLGKIGIFEYLIVNRQMLRIYRLFKDQDAYVLKDKLMHPDTINFFENDKKLTGDELRIKNNEIISNLEYYPLEKDVLEKLKSGDIDFETAKYLMNE